MISECKMIRNSPKIQDGCVHLGGRLYRPVKQVLFLKSEHNYTHIYFQDGEHHIVAYTLKKLSIRLEEYGFWRCHKSYLINLRYARFWPNEGFSKIRGFDPLPISRRRMIELPTVMARQKALMVSK